MRFPVGCAEPARAPFTRGVAFLYSFGYEAAREAFAAAVGEDPACGMAQWGIAMTYYYPLWALPMLAELAAGATAAEQAA